MGTIFAMGSIWTGLSISLRHTRMYVPKIIALVHPHPPCLNPRLLGGNAFYPILRLCISTWNWKYQRWRSNSKARVAMNSAHQVYVYIYACGLNELSSIVFPQWPRFAFYLETGNVKGQGKKQGSQWILVLIKVYMHATCVKLEL